MEKIKIKVSDLKKMNPGRIFACWKTLDNEKGLNIWNSWKEIYWVSVSGNWYHDWTVYMSWEWNNYIWVWFSKVDYEIIAKMWDKAPKSYIKNILDVDDEVFALFRT